MRLHNYLCFVLVVCLCMAWSPLAGYASMVPAGDFIPSVPVGTPTANNFVSVDLGSYLSHVYDENKESARRWGGKIWNWLVNEDLCPEAYAQEVNGGLHHFVYGYTMRDGVAGYYNYCEYCGQFTGDIIQKERPKGWGGTRGGGVNEINNGKLVVYGQYYLRGVNQGPTAQINSVRSWGNPLGLFETYTSFNIYKDPHVYNALYGSGTYGYSIRSTNSGINVVNAGSGSFSQSSGYWYAGSYQFGLFFPGVESGYDIHNINIGDTYSGKYLLSGFQDGSVDIETGYNDINVVAYRYNYSLNNVPGVAIVFANNAAHVGIGQSSYGTAYKYAGLFVDYGDEDIYFTSAGDNNLTEQSSDYYDTTYMTINAPISYNKVEGDTVNSYYGGTLNNYVDLGNNTLNFYNIDLGGLISGKISFDSYTYNYDNSTATFDLSNTDDSITITYGDEYTEIDYIQDGSITEDVELYYITNLNSPINEVTIEETIPLPTPEPTATPGGSGDGGSGSGSGSGNGGGNINADIDVNVNYPEVTVQVPIIADGQTQGVVTAPQNIPEGLYDIRESLAQGAGVIQAGAGDVADFVRDGFEFLPDNIRYMISIGNTKCDAN